jgi:hypothetical protein
MTNMNKINNNKTINNLNQFSICLPSFAAQLAPFPRPWKLGRIHDHSKMFQ